MLKKKIDHFKFAQFVTGSCAISLKKCHADWEKKMIVF